MRLMRSLEEALTDSIGLIIFCSSYNVNIVILQLELLNLCIYLRDFSSIELKFEENLELLSLL